MTDTPGGAIAAVVSQRRDAFNRLVGDKVDNLVGCVAYCHYKTAKREWINEYIRDHAGAAPNEEQRKAWTANWTETMMTAVETKAKAAIAEYAAEVIDNERPAIREDALRGTFVRGVSEAVVGGIVFAILLLVIFVIATNTHLDLRVLWENFVHS